MKRTIISLWILSSSHCFAVVYSTQPANNPDCHLESYYPDDNTSGAVNVQTGVANDGGSLNVCRTLIEFDLSSIPSGSLCVGATLYLTLTYADNPASDRATSVYSIRSGRSDWNYLEATWNDYKASTAWGTAGCSNTSTDYDSTAIGTFNSPTSYPNVSTITLTASAVQTWFGAVNSNYGIMIKQDTESNNYRKKEWASSNSATASYYPKLVVEYTATATVSPITPVIILLE